MAVKKIFLGPIFLIGLMISILSGLVTFLLSREEVSSLILTLMFLVLTMITNLFSAIKETEERLISSSDIIAALKEEPLLWKVIPQIVNDYLATKKLGAPFYLEEANRTLVKTRRHLHKMADGRMVQDIANFGTVKMNLGEKPSKNLKAVSVANPDFWRNKYGQYIMRQNAKAIKRGVDITYVWIQDIDTLAENLDILKKQDAIGVKVYCTLPDRVSDYYQAHYRIKDDKVVFRYELGRNGHAKTQRVFINPVEVDTAVEDFETLIKYSHPLKRYLPLLAKKRSA